MKNIKSTPFPQHPAYPDALNIGDLEIGKEIEVICEYGKAVLNGSVATLPEYEDEGWQGLSLDNDGESVELCVYEVGIVCSRTGVWSDFHARSLD